MFLNDSSIHIPMKKYEYLEGIVTADAAFDAYGKTLQELFENSATATTGVMIELKTLSAKITKKIKITAENAEQLLYKFLEQIVFLKDSESILFKTYKIKITQTQQKKFELIAECKGDKINPQKQKLGNDIKAVTYHNFKVEQQQNEWKARVILDI